MTRTRYPGIQRLTDGKFRVRIKVTDPKTGRRKDKRIVIAATTNAEANVERERLRRAVEAAPTGTRQRLRLGEYAESWMLGKIPSLKDSTSSHYSSVLDLHILPHFGDWFVDTITKTDIEEWRNRQKCDPVTVNGWLRVLRTLFRQATYDLDLPRNPMERVQNLRVPHSEEPNRLRADELGLVLAHLRNRSPQWYAMVLTLAFTGSRFGEVAAMRWSDIDEERGTIRFPRSVYRNKVDDTKTGVVKAVPLPDVLAQVLREHRQSLMTTRPQGLEAGWVFPNRKGGLSTPSVLSRPFKRALQDAGITRRQTVHGLRRTMNNLLRQVTGGEVVRSITGHVTAGMTLHYSHVEDHEKAKAIDQVVQMVSGTRSGTFGGISAEFLDPKNSES